jgi:alkyl hydroperoxide reductase subunit D
MSINALKQKLPPFAKDVSLNLSSIANDETFGVATKHGLLLAAAAATRNAEVLAAIAEEAGPHLSPEAKDAAFAAAAIMAMNNIYYRFVHLASNKAYASMPAKLRMNVLAKPGVAKTDFELWSLAVSAINGCGTCIDAHEKALAEAGIGREAIQTAVRYAAILQSAAVALEAAHVAALAA